MDKLDEIRHIANAFFEAYLHDVPGHWHFRWDHARRRAGACHHHKSLITLSRPIAELGTVDDAVQTLLHEIAHAIVGKDENHGPRWLETARSIGYTGRVRHSGPTPDHLARWAGRCPAGHTVLRYRRPRNMVASCTRCHPHFNRAHLIVWEQLR